MSKRNRDNRRHKLNSKGYFKKLLKTRVEHFTGQVGNFNFCVVCIYRPPSGRNDLFFDTLNMAMCNLRVLCNRIVLAGDFNFDFLTDGSVALTSFLKSYGFQILIDKPTRMGACLDNICVNFNEVHSPEVWSTLLSDHKSICIGVDLLPKLSEVNVYMFRPITQCGMFDAFQELYYADWSFVDDNTVTVDDVFDLFLSRIVGLLRTPCL